MKRILLSILFFVAAVTVSQAQIPEDGLVGRYEMNNSLQDFGPNGYHLEPFGAGGVILPTPDRFGEIDSAMHFINEYANMPSNPNVFDFDATSNMSLSVWIKIEASIADWTGLLNNWAGFGIGGYYLGITPDQQVRWNVNADPPIDSDPIPSGEWVHIAVSYDGTTAFLYINGAMVGQESYGLPLLPSAFPFTVAAQADVDTNKFPGVVDEILVYERPLTAQEVLDIYNNVPLSISDYDILSNRIQIAPNPAQASFSVSSDPTLGALVSYQITDMKGVVVLKANITNLKNSFDVSTLSSGSYLLTFKNENGLEITKRLMKY